MTREIKLNDFDGITELTKLTEFFMKKAANGIAWTITFPNGVWERGKTVLMLILMITLNGCATTDNSHPYGPDYYEPTPQNVPQVQMHAVVTP